MKNLKTIFWDFDGVILNSNNIRTKGFRKVLSLYPKTEVDELINFHIANGGLSRYFKFRYFYEEILKIKVNDDHIQELASKFSEIMQTELYNKNLLIKNTMNFIEKNRFNYDMHIVSGSDGLELLNLCNFLDIQKYFLQIKGSPTEKKYLIQDIMSNYNYKPSECILVGDSINDFEAANENKIFFMGVVDRILIQKSNFLLF